MSRYNFQISNSIFGVRIKSWPKSRPKWWYRAETGQCRISANIQSRAPAKASWVIICTDLSNGGLILVLAAIFRDRCTSWSQTYSTAHWSRYCFCLIFLRERVKSWGIDQIQQQVQVRYTHRLITSFSVHLIVLAVISSLTGSTCVVVVVNALVA